MKTQHCVHWLMLIVSLISLVVPKTLIAEASGAPIKEHQDELDVPFELHGGEKSELPNSNILQIAEAVRVSNIYTWTQDSQSDWATGTLVQLDDAYNPGELQLAQRSFWENIPLMPYEELAATQQNPAIAVDIQGNAYAVWADDRDGSYDIYFAYRPVGGAWGGNVKVNDDVGLAVQSAPRIAVDAQGNAYVVWTDERNGNYDIYFSYRPAGGMWMANVKVNDDVGVTSQSAGALAVDDNGNVYAIWTDQRNGNYDIYFSYRPVGGIWTANVKVNDDVGASSQSAGALAVDDNGNVYAIWTDQRNGNMDIYFSTRSMDGEWVNNIKVNDGIGASGWISPFPDIAVDGAGNAYAIWTDMRNNWSGDIYSAYRPAGGNWGANVRVNDDTGTRQQAWPAIAVDDNNNAYAVWYDTRDSGDIYFAFHPAGGTWGTNFRVNDISNSSGYGTRDIIIEKNNNNAYVIWGDNRNYNLDIYFAACPAAGPCTTNSKVNDDPGSAGEQSPDIVVDNSNNAYAIWQDTRLGESDIYFSYRPANGVWGASTKVSDDPGTANQLLPALTVDGANNIYAIWRDQRDLQINDVYFSTRSPDGVWSTNVKVNDVSAPAFNTGGVPALATDDAGNSYALWEGSTNFYFSYRSVDGVWGTNIVVTNTGANPSIAVDSLGNAYAVGANNTSDIYFSYRPAGGTWETGLKINDAASDVANAPAIAVDDAGNAYAIWHEYRSGSGSNDYDIYFAYRPTNGAWGSSVRVNDDTSTTPQGNPDLAVDGAGNAYAVWEDARTDSNYDIYLAYRPAGGTWGVNVKVNDDSSNAAQREPAVAIDSNRDAHIVWKDRRNSTTHLYYATSSSESVYYTNGMYTSPELDASVTNATWERISYSATIPTNTSLAFETRSRTRVNTWSAWQSLTPEGHIASPVGQYLQYRVTFNTSSAVNSPALDWVKVSYLAEDTPPASHFTIPCGTTNQLTPTIKGASVAGSVVRLYVNGTEVLTTTTDAAGVFTFLPIFEVGSYLLSVTAENVHGVGPSSPSLALTVDPTLAYDSLMVRTGQWSKDGWLLSPPRDEQGCANPDGWQVWPRPDEKFAVQVPVSYTTSAAVTVTVGTQTITLTEGTGKVFAGVFQPPLTAGDFIIVVTADGQTATINGSPVLIDPDGFVYEASGTINDTLPGVQVTCYYSDTHSGQWIVWDAWNYDNQINPQTTLDDGYYSFYVPAGMYRVTAEKEGYPLYTSPDLSVTDAPVRHNIPLEASTICTTPLTDVDIVGPLGITSTLYIDTLYTFQAIITPATATLPITYIWTPAPNSGQNTEEATYRWTTPGIYTVTLAAENCGGPITAARQITIAARDGYTIYLPLVLRNQ